jgi:ABC-2 type transport system permease protein
MLWYKAWLETRWRFLVGMGLLLLFAGLGVAARPAVANMQVEIPNLGGRLGELVREGLALMNSYRGYVWSQWFGKNLLQFWTLFAVLIGVGGLATERAGGVALWTLSLPVTRRRLLAVRAGVGALELLALAVVPSLVVCLLSPLIGESYPITEALFYSLMLYLGGAFFYGLALLLSTIFQDQLKAVLAGLSVAVVMGLLSLISEGATRYSVYRVMTAQSYFTGGAPPWAGLLVCLAAGALMFFVSLRLLERRDF